MRRINKLDDEKLKHIRQMTKSLTRKRKRKVRRDFDKKEVIIPDNLDKATKYPTFGFDTWLENHRVLIAERDAENE